MRTLSEFNPKSLVLHPQLPCFSPRSLVTILSELSMSTLGGHPYHAGLCDAKNFVVHGTATYRCDDTRDCIIQFCPPYDEHICSKHVEAWNKLIIKFSASSGLILINKLQKLFDVWGGFPRKTVRRILYWFLIAKNQQLALTKYMWTLYILQYYVFRRSTDSSRKQHIKSFI